MRRIFPVFFLYLLFYISNLQAQGAKDIYPSSLLSTGQWVKVAITSDGVYRLNYSLLKQKGLTNLSNPRVFCNNSGQLSYYNDRSASDDLKEIAIYTSTGSDGIFNEGDYLLFFGKGTHRWNYNETTGEYTFLRHNYSDTAFYFVTSGALAGKKITSVAEPAQTADYISSQSDAFFFYEPESENILHSGRDWFQKMYSLNGIPIKPAFTDLVQAEKIKYSIRVAAQASSPTQFRFYEGAALKKNIIVQGLNLSNYTGIRAQITDSSGYFAPLSAAPEFEIRFSPEGQQGAQGWLDFVRLQARVMNSFNGKTKIFSDKRSISPGRTTSFNIKTQSNESFVWDVSDPLNARQVVYNRDGENIAFKAKTDSLKTFLIFTAAGAVTPDIIKIITNQNLHASDAAEMVIITHPLFIQYARKLADIHLKNSGLTSLIVTPEEIYNEFSGGIQDIAALRNFLRFKYHRQLGTSMPLKYLLLFGDGSFENKTLPPNSPNFIPTYQSANSNVVVSSFTSDDFYGLLEDGEGEAEGTEDIGIGRFPVSDTLQAGIIISKIRKYLDHSSMGDWRNVITLTADDEDGNAHMSDAEGLNMVIKDKAPQINVEKIYFDAFRQITNVNGQTYPDATRAINNRINSGCLIFNYTGHANEMSLANENVVQMDDIRSWKNGGRLPVFITATCEFSRFDEVVINLADGKMSNKASAGEAALLNKDGGAIALMSTTRVVFSAPNFYLNRNIFSCAFNSDSEGNAIRLGDIIRIAKNNSGSGANKRNFTLLGDPALRLAFPWHGVVTDSVNSMPVTAAIDSLRALSLVTISGHIEDRKGVFMNNFDGIVSPLVYDKENKIKTYANDGGPVMEFYMRNNVLFSGQTLAKKGRFRFSFIVPRDINYSFGEGKISYYAHNSSDDMNGSFSKIIVGGFSNAGSTDSIGPVIKLFMNDTLFRNGGMTDKNPVLLAIIEDKGGINTSGSGIGHDLTGFLDDERNSSFILNNYYINDFDNYRKGKITYYLAQLDEGSHSFTVKAWDNFNNSSEESITFIVDKGEGFILKKLFNYPNPFTGETRITGEINKPGANIEVTLNIYNMSGKLIRIIKNNLTTTGYTLPPVTWDGNDNGGNRVARGMYPYVVIIKSASGETSRSSGRLIIL